LPGITPDESAEIVLLLMSLDKPDERVRRAIDSAAEWFESTKILGKRVQVVTGAQYEKGKDKVVVDDPNAPPLWARFYDIETNKPFFCSRDGIKRDSMDQISHERRNGYSWYGAWGEKVEQAYPQWKQRIGAASQP